MVVVDFRVLEQSRASLWRKSSISGGREGRRGGEGEERGGEGEERGRREGRTEFLLQDSIDSAID